MASCTQIESSIQAYVDGELKSSEKVVVEQHVVACRKCQALLQRHQAASAILFESFAPHRLQHDLSGSIMAHLPEMSHNHQTGHEVTLRAKNSNKPSTFFLRFMPALAPILLLVLGFAIFQSWPVNEPIGESIGMVIAQEGRVLRSQELSTKRSKVKLQRTVVAKDRFETGEAATLMIGLAGPSELKLDENTRVKIGHYREVSVEQGRAWFNVSKGKDYFRVMTPNGVVTVFGTTFTVDVDELSTKVMVASGEVQVENGLTFQNIRPGQEVSLSPESQILVPQAIDADFQMAWADEIQADPSTQSLFQERVQPFNEVLRAKQVFVVETGKAAIQSILFQWEPDGFSTGHSGYFIYVSDDNMKPLFKGHIKASLFNDQTRSQFELSLPETQALETIQVLHINVLPDKSTGTVGTSFREVAALKG